MFKQPSSLTDVSFKWTIETISNPRFLPDSPRFLMWRPGQPAPSSTGKQFCSPSVNHFSIRTTCPHPKFLTATWRASRGGMGMDGLWHVLKLPGLVMTNSLRYWKLPFIVDLLIYPLKMVIFHSFLYVYQRVMMAIQNQQVQYSEKNGASPGHVFSK